MRVCAHQPVYLPGAIFFNKVALCDAIIFIGHVQLERNSWQTRNRIRNNSSGGEMYLSVPVKTKNKSNQAINDTEIANRQWTKKHLRSIELTYSNTPFYEEYYPKLLDIMEKPWTSLSEMNKEIIKEVMDWLGLSTAIQDSSDISWVGKKTEMLVSLAENVGAKEYVSNRGASAYVEINKFAEAGIEHLWQSFSSPIYDQGRENFVPDLSIIDMIFNLGPEASRVIKECGAISKN